VGWVGRIVTEISRKLAAVNFAFSLANADSN